MKCLQMVSCRCPSVCLNKVYILISYAIGQFNYQYIRVYAVLIFRWYHAGVCLSYQILNSDYMQLVSSTFRDKRAKVLQYSSVRLSYNLK